MKSKPNSQKNVFGRRLAFFKRAPDKIANDHTFIHTRTHTLPNAYYKQTHIKNTYPRASDTST
jgi:hypothetical protein